MGIELNPWEAKTLRRLSSAFIAQQHDAKKNGCPAPYACETPELIENRVTSQFKAMMAAFPPKQ